SLLGSFRSRFSASWSPPHSPPPAPCSSTPPPLPRSPAPPSHSLARRPESAPAPRFPCPAAPRPSSALSAVFRLPLAARPPTGTIGFMMDCDTTGIEPDLALVKYKKLVGGGMIKIVNQTVPTALFKLGYTHEQTDAIVSYIDATGTIEGAPHVKDEHLAVFDCSFKPAKGTRFIHYMGHLRMMAATQPFLSGAISKTVNLPEQASVEEIMEVYIQSWKLGLKAVAIYRDGCKKSQPLSAAGTKTAESGTTRPGTAASAVPGEEENLNAPPRAVRHRLKEERMAVTHK